MGSYLNIGKREISSKAESEVMIFALRYVLGKDGDAPTGEHFSLSIDDISKTILGIEDVLSDEDSFRLAKEKFDERHGGDIEQKVLQERLEASSLVLGAVLAKMVLSDEHYIVCFWE